MSNDEAPLAPLPKDALGDSPSQTPCHDCAHDLPGEIMRCPGVYSLCPTCHGKGYIDGEEAKGTTIGNAFHNLKKARLNRKKV